MRTSPPRRARFLTDRDDFIDRLATTDIPNTPRSWHRWKGFRPDHISVEQWLSENDKERRERDWWKDRTYRLLPNPLYALREPITEAAKPNDRRTATQAFLEVAEELGSEAITRQLTPQERLFYCQTQAGYDTFDLIASNYSPDAGPDTNLAPPPLHLIEHDHWRGKRPKGLRRLTWKKKLDKDEAKRDAWESEVWANLDNPKELIRQCASAHSRRYLCQAISHVHDLISNADEKTSAEKVFCDQYWKLSSFIYRAGSGTTDNEYESEVHDSDSEEDMTDDAETSALIEDPTNLVPGSDDNITGGVADGAGHGTDEEFLRAVDGDTLDEDLDEQMDAETTTAKGKAIQLPGNLINTNFSNPEKSIGGKAKRKAERELKSIYKDRVSDEEEEDESEDEVCDNELLKEKSYHGAIYRMRGEFQVYGLQFTIDQEPDSNNPLSVLYNHARGTLYGHYKELAERQGLPDGSVIPNSSEASVVRRVKVSLQGAKRAFLSGGYIENRRTSNHWTNKVPPHHEVLATRFTTAYGTVNPSISASISTLRLPHLSLICLPGEFTQLGVGAGSGFGSKNNADSIASNAASIAATVEREVKRLQSRITEVENRLGSESAKDEPQTFKAALKAAFEKLSGKISQNEDEFSEVLSKAADKIKDLCIQQKETTATFKKLEARVDESDQARTTARKFYPSELKQIVDHLMPKVKITIKEEISTVERPRVPMEDFEFNRPTASPTPTPTSSRLTFNRDTPKPSRQSETPSSKSTPKPMGAPPKGREAKFGKPMKRKSENKVH
ncbi:hypothetical protein G7Z17_g9301 [Cylindrodendrum hubeiense]|uniref:Uncharacterized protein n=1 Tax=Cylindrodendrum hubeiense TaxID=595255 RepID=A0A9P5L899_9HYPO|nr:hypothetical protein G7Z17_g9301 [Cylindrodendrum hubeiense]